MSKSSKEIKQRLSELESRINKIETNRVELGKVMDEIKGSLDLFLKK